MSTISASTTSTTAYKVTADTTGTLVLQTGATPTTAVTIDTSQNVGIGTSSPSTLASGNLLVVNGSVATGPVITTGYGATNGSVTAIELGAGRTGSADSYLDFHATAGTDYDFRVLRSSGANGNACFLNAGTGGYLVNVTTNPSTAAFYVAGTFAGTGWVGRAGTSGTSNGNLVNIFWTGSAAQLWIDGVNNGNITTVSDYRVKKAIQTQTVSALDRIAQLRPVTYTHADFGTVYKADGVAREGFIAHELQEVIPSAVEGTKDDENQIQSLKLDALCSVMVKAIQEQQALITQLQADVAALKGQ